MTSYICDRGCCTVTNSGGGVQGAPRVVTYNGEQHTLKSLGAMFGLSTNAVGRRIDAGFCLLARRTSVGRPPKKTPTVSATDLGNKFARLRWSAAG